MGLAREGEAQEFSCKKSTTARNRYVGSLNIRMWNSSEKSWLVLQTWESVHISGI